MAATVVILAAALFLSVLSTASPVISFPINSQVPRVARVGESFAFVFSPSTFTSGSQITYSLSDAPRWLSVDSDSRLLFGTPGPNDVVLGPVAGVPLNLVATDDSGSTTLAATLVVSQRPGPRVEIPISKQVPGFGTFSAPLAVLSTPGEAFSFQLDSNTFSEPSGAPISYYATMVDNSPLPAWITFDPSRLLFAGRTPPSESLIEPPQRFSFQLIASDVVGFAGASLDFDIVVGNHRLTAGKTTIVLNATTGVPVSYTGLRGSVTVDGKPVAPETVALAATPGLPAWLSVNNHTWDITGVPSQTAESTNFTVTLVDIFSNTLNLTVAVQMADGDAGLFAGKQPQFSVTPGKPFSFDLRPYLSNPHDTEVTVKGDSSYPWIRFEPSTATLFGDAPDGLTDSAIDVKMQATSTTSRQSASFSFKITIRDVSADNGSMPAHPTTTNAHPAASSGNQLSLAGDSIGDDRFNPVLLAVLLPLLLLLSLAVCALFWYFRRRKANQRPALSTRDISGPLPGSFRDFVTRTPGSGATHSLPDFTKRFGKSFSADDVFGPVEKTYLDPRNAVLARPELLRAQHVSPVRVLPPSASASSDPGTSMDSSSTLVGTSGALATSRTGTRGKVNSSLSSITEKSIAELADSRGVESLGSHGRRSFRDRIEINIPRLEQMPGSAAASSPSTTEALATPWPGSSQAAQELDAALLGGESRVSQYPPAPAIRKLSWPWLGGAKGKQQGPKLVSGMERLNEQSNVLTVDTVDSGKAYPGIPDTQMDNGNEMAVLESSSLTPPTFPGPAPPSRPPTRSDQLRTERRGKRGRGQLNASDTTTDPATRGGTCLSSDKGCSAPGLLAYGECPANSLVANEGIIQHTLVRPSRTWSTVPTTDDWADDTVESPALSRSASQQQHNWTVLHESPTNKSRDANATTLARLPDSDALLRPPPRICETEGGEEKGVGVSPVGPSPGPSRLGMAPALAPEGSGNGRREMSGLTRKSQSKGVSLRSEGSRSDYAVFI